MICNDRLSSGLEVVHYAIPHTRFVDIALAVGVGTRFEPKALNGIAHFTEHILFRGCRQLPSGFELNRAFDRIGDGLNALTHKEYTMFMTKVPVGELARALTLLSAVVTEPLFCDVDTERGIILEEILEELDEKGREMDLDTISRHKIFGAHPLSYPVLGRPRSIKRITEETLRKFHEEYYVPTNMVLGVAGGVTWPAARETVEKTFSRKAPAGSRVPIAPAAGLEDLKRGVHFIDDTGSQVDVLFSFFMPGERAPGELARMFIARLLDDGISSRLQRTVCDRRGLLYDISCGIEAFTDVSLFDIEFSVSPEKIVEVIDLVLGELKLLREELVGADEFSMVQERFRRDIYVTAESTHGMATLLSEAFLLRLPMPVDSREYEARIKEITPESVRSEARAAFQFERCAFFAKGKVRATQQKIIHKLLKDL